MGQPRDRDPRASYAVLHEVDDPPANETIGELRGEAKGAIILEFVRLEYDVEKAVKKILAVPELDDFLGNRLLDGR